MDTMIDDDYTIEDGQPVSESALKPCPFCGGVAERDEEGVSCSNVAGCDFGGYVDKEVWNMRPVEDALRAEAERQRTENEELHDVLIKWMEANAAATVLINEQRPSLVRRRKLLEQALASVERCAEEWDMRELDALAAAIRAEVVEVQEHV